MSNCRDEYDSLQAELSLYRSEFQNVIKMLTPEQLGYLLDVTSGTLRDLDSLWGNSPSVSQRSTLHSYKVIKHVITQQLEIAEGAHLPARELRMICINCNLPVPNFDKKFICIGCGSTEWIEVDHIEPPTESSV